MGKIDIGPMEEILKEMVYHDKSLYEIGKRHIEDVKNQDELTKRSDIIINEVDKIEKQKENLTIRINSIDYPNSNLEKEEEELNLKIKKLRKEMDCLLTDQDKFEKSVKATKEMFDTRFMQKKTENIGLLFLIIGISAILSVIITSWMKNNVVLITGLFSNITLREGYFIFGVVVFVIGIIVYNRSNENTENYIDEKSKIKTCFNFIKILVRPKSLEITFIVVFIVVPVIYVFTFSNVFESMQSNRGFLFYLAIHNGFIAIVIMEFRKLFKFLFANYKKEIKNSEDRLTIAVAVLGTIISLLALFT